MSFNYIKNHCESCDQTGRLTHHDFPQEYNAELKDRMGWYKDEPAAIPKEEVSLPLYKSDLGWMAHLLEDLLVNELAEPLEFDLGMPCGHADAIVEGRDEARKDCIRLINTLRKKVEEITHEDQMSRDLFYRADFNKKELGMTAEEARDEAFAFFEVSNN